MSETSDFMARQISELDQRVSNHEERLAAIERAATCGTGPNEPMRSSPAQAAVGEATAVSEWPRYFESVCFEGVGRLLMFSHADGYGVDIEPGGESRVTDYDLDEALNYVKHGDWREVPAAEANARIAAARGEKPSAIPPTAERGETFMADESRCLSTIRAIVECVMMQLDLNNHDFRLRDKLIVAAAPYLEPHEKEIAALRAESERLKALDKDYCDSANKYAQEISNLRQQLATRTRQRDEAREKLRKRTSEVETWLGVILQANEAIDGNVDEPEKLPGRVAQIVAQLATARKKLEQEEQAHLATIDERDRAVDAADRLAAIAGDESVIGEHSNTNDPWKNAAEILATSRAAAEAMEWLNKTRRKLLFGFNYGGTKGWFIEGELSGAYPTPTAAILAARDAANTGEKK